MTIDDLREGSAPDGWRLKLVATVKLLFFIDRRVRPETPARFAADILIGAVFASLKANRPFPEFRPAAGPWPQCLVDSDELPDALTASILRAFYVEHDLDWRDAIQAETIHEIARLSVLEALPDA